MFDVLEWQLRLATNAVLEYSGHLLVLGKEEFQTSCRYIHIDVIPV
jgi:hypothetical protein